MPSEKIIQLHRALAERGFAVCSFAEEEREASLVEIPVLQGGLTQGELVEISAEGASGGGGMIMREIVHAIAMQGAFLALVDGADTFDPGSFDAALLARILWVRTRTVEEVIKTADLLLRDGNFPLVIMQLRGMQFTTLRRVPSQHWYRLQRLAKEKGTTCLVMTPQLLVPCARKRWVIGGRFVLDDLDRDAVEVLPRMRVQLQARQGTQQRTAMTAHAG